MNFFFPLMIVRGMTNGTISNSISSKYVVPRPFLDINIGQMFTLEKILPLAMYGSLPNSEQLKVFWTAPKDTRKVVVATNIAETSITIPGVVYGNYVIEHFSKM